jgi:DNA primase
VNKYGSKEDYKRIKLILPIYAGNHINVFRKNNVNQNLISCPLPEGYTLISSTIKSKMHKIAYDYLIKDRKLSIDQIVEHQIGYTEIGAYRNRVIIPSFNEHENINYFEARAFIKKMKPPYYKPDKKVFVNKNVPEKYDIIFNEKNINWDLPIYLVEGVFDMFRIPNSIPMLGKTPSWFLTSKIIEHKSTVIICLDEDAFKDSFEIYQQLSSLGINTFFVDLKGLGDISFHYEQNGQKAITELLKTKTKINFCYKMFKLLS